MFIIEDELKKLPAQPGVYLMKDKNDNVIYVGKAVVLKNRVRQYFRKNEKTTRIQRMVSLIDHFYFIRVHTSSNSSNVPSSFSIFILFNVLFRLNFGVFILNVFVKGDINFINVSSGKL